ncbi:hypothetical protein PBCVOR070422_130L [Paramecium bursaria Chlorella virus OR0704.2.2]|nr:hypothetical protein PBCVOR070422_130L [Paramecium bursaria Chlorella virus OR0704.2.2]
MSFDPGNSKYINRKVCVFCLSNNQTTKMFLYNRPSDTSANGCFCEVPTIIYDSQMGTEICTACGVVLERVLDESPEYGYDENGTDISYASSFSGVVIQTDNALTNKIQKTTMTSADVESSEMKKTIHTICDAFHIPSPNVIRDTAIELSSMLREKVKICGKKRYACYAVAVYFACSLNHAKRELRSFHTVCSVEIKNLNFAVKTFRQYIGEQLVEKNNPHDALISSTIAKFSISEEHKKTLRKLVLNMADQHTGIFDSGRKPRTIIASLIMINVFRSDVPLDMREIADVMQICHSSISSGAKDLSKTYNIEF